MWGCNWGPFYSHPMIGMLVNLLMLVTIVYIIVLIVRSFISKGKNNQDTVDSLEIIKSRLARGEITEEEYQRIRNIITG